MSSLVEGSAPDAGLPEQQAIRLVLRKIIDLGGVAEMKDLYAPVESVLNARGYTLSQQGRDSLREVVNRKAVRAGFLLPFDSDNSGWRVTQAGREFAVNDEDKEDAVIAAVEVARGQARGQGFAASPEVRKVVEDHAMERAKAHFRAEGFAVEVLGKPYDLLCTRGDEVLRVEVKGTTTAGAQVLLTPNEVQHARDYGAIMVLYLLAHIDVQRGESGVVASGGTVRVVRPWSIDTGTLAPVGFTYTLPPE